jgi:two-component system chemotaxis response regulator CheB
VSVRRDIVVIGASAGGIHALIEIIERIPADFSGTIMVVVHTPPTGPAMLPRILERAGKLPASHAQHNDTIVPGTIVVAPPDHHLLVRAGHVELSKGPRENHTRPAVDPLFRSAARAYGSRTIGVVLSGALGDGTAGLMAVKAHGGIALVQDPSDAVVDAMPRSAIKLVDVDAVLPAAELAAEIVRLTRQSIIPTGGTAMVDDERAQSIIKTDIAEQALDQRNQELTLFSCPDCGGSLWQVDEGPLLRFHCHVGHAYASESLLALKSEEVEAALWQCVRLLTERATLARQVMARNVSGGNGLRLSRSKDQILNDEHHADVIRNLLVSLVQPTFEPSDAVRS